MMSDPKRGAGRPPAPGGPHVRTLRVRCNQQQFDHCTATGNPSEYVRGLIEREMKMEYILFRTIDACGDEEWITVATGTLAEIQSHTGAISAERLAKINALTESNDPGANVKVSDHPPLFLRRKPEPLDPNAPVEPGPLNDLIARFLTT